MLIGQRYSTSIYACMIKFSGGGPYDGGQGLFDNDHYCLTISTSVDGVQYDYRRVDAKHFRLARIYVDGKRVDIWKPTEGRSKATS